MPSDPTPTDRSTTVFRSPTGGRRRAADPSGHTKGHVAIAVRTSDLTLLFAGDHLLRQSHYVADTCRGRDTANLYARLTTDTNRRLRRFVDQFPTMLLPSHDAEAAGNIAHWEPLQII